MTLEELYGKLIADDGLKESLAQAKKDDALEEWVRAQGVEASEDEIVAYIMGIANEKLSVDDVDKVAGGEGYWSTICEITYYSDVFG